MYIVAIKLAEWSVEQKNISDADLFGRSAFNRHYYSVYLRTREMLVSLDSGWETSGHKDIPDLLTGKIRKKIKEKIKVLVNDGLLHEQTGIELSHRYHVSAGELSSLLKAAYQVRVTADYYPNVKLQSVEGNILLDGHSIHSAREWTNRARHYCGSIQKVWNDVFGI